MGITENNIVMKLSFFIFVFAFGSASRQDDDEDWLVTNTDCVLDYKFNPILEPEDILEWILGAPTLVLIEETNQLHLFVNEVFHGILHYSADYNQPFNFTKRGTVIPDAGAVRPYVLRDGEKLYQAIHLFR